MDGSAVGSRSRHRGALIEDEEDVPVSRGGAELCREHGESLCLFCVDDLEPVCERCAEWSHVGHRVYPATEAVTDCKGELRNSTSRLEGKVTQLQKVIKTCGHISKHNQVQARLTEGQIKEEFAELHLFLREEEEARLAALKGEGEEKRREVEERREQLLLDMNSLEEEIRLIEEEMDAEGDGVEFLQNYQDMLKSTFQSHRDPEKVFGCLIDVAKHLGNLQYTVWNKMRYIAPYTPVTLDPKTAYPSLSLSPGLNSVHMAHRKPQALIQDQDVDVPVPANPERFRLCPCVLAREAYSSGYHCWDVMVEDSDNWTVGVASEAVSRKEEFEACPEAGVWAICLRAGKYRALTTPTQILHLDEVLQKLRVSLDWDQGRVGFTDADSGAHIFTFEHRFMETVHPYFESRLIYQELVVAPQDTDIDVTYDPIPVADAPIAEEGGVIVNGTVTGNAGSRENGTNASAVPVGSPVKDPTASARSKKTTGKNATHAEQVQIREKGSGSKTRAPGKASAKKDQTARATPAGKAKATEVRSPANKQKRRRRFDVTYQVSLNSALQMAGRASSHS